MNNPDAARGSDPRNKAQQISAL